MNMPKYALVWIATALAIMSALDLNTAARAQAPTPAPGAEPDMTLVTDNQVNAIARQLYCPVCENVPLDVCPTQACAEWRELIREQLASGMSEAEIKQYFVNRFGDRVMATPPARGLNWLAYIIPPLAILLGAFLVFRAMRMWQRQAGPAANPEQSTAEPAQAAEIDPYIEKLENELRERDASFRSPK